MEIKEGMGAGRLGCGGDVTVYYIIRKQFESNQPRGQDDDHGQEKIEYYVVIMCTVRVRSSVAGLDALICSSGYGVRVMSS